MLLTRQDIEAREQQMLAPYAALSGESRGREYPEDEDPYRPCFQRDRDRIIHSKAFRRLRGKTQVFFAGFGDHYRSRLAHSMEVAQIGRAIARTLALNEDLAEAIGLAHDLGHTPFGHAGQDAMHELMQGHGSRFEHNEQSLRIVEVLERKHPEHPGLNLTFELRDGLIKHRTFYDHPIAADHHMPSLEAQVVNIADEIAYLNHDIDDGVRAGILSLEGFDSLEIWQQAKPLVDQSLEPKFRVGLMISAVMGLMVEDFVNHTERLLRGHHVSSLDDVYRSETPLVGFSDAMKPMARDLKIFLYDHFYFSKQVSRYNEENKKVIRALFARLLDNPDLIPDDFRRRISADGLPMVVKDYLAGMTDQYALNLYHSSS